MDLLNKLSVRNKLIAIIFCVSAASLLGGFSLVILNDIKTFNEDLAEKMITTTRIIADYSEVDLTFGDKSASQQTLAILDGFPTVEAAYLYDAEGKLFSSYKKAGIPSQPPKPPFTKSAEFSENHLHVSQIIQQKDKFLGTIYLKISTEPLQKKVRNYLITMIALALALLAASLIFGALLQRVISKPILNLTEISKKISEKEDYSIRVSHSSEDEIGTLSTAFNKMLSQIQKRQSEREAAEEALRESEDRYRRLVESSPEAIFVEQEGKIVYMNSSGLKMMNYDSMEALQGIGLCNLLYIPAEKIESQFESKLTLPRELQFRTKDGTYLDVEVSFIRSVYQGKEAIQGIARDITERKALQQSAHRMERLAAIGEFAAVVAHEMRNSLGSIGLNFRFLSEKLQVPEAYKRNFSNIQSSMTRIQAVIKDILDFSRPSPPVFKRVPMELVLDSSLLAVEKDLEQAGVTVEKAYSGDSSEVMVDAIQVSQVFVNLFLNAIQAMPSGGTIRVLTERNAEEMLVIVQDTGKGIPAEILSKIFNPFFTTRKEGVGLGLAIVSRTLEQHQAKIAVKSEVNQGTSFTIRFPVAQ